MTIPSPERTLVTFALFAYNQEDFIREAIEGAFSQTYEPLEIIISDDNSTDRTFEIICDMVTNYKGPHLVKFIKQEQNLGLAFHINTVLQQAQGNYIVMAAGDDTSAAERTQISVDLLESTSALLCHSNISPIGGQLRFNFSELCLLKNMKLEEIATAEKLYVGATGVISRKIFDKYGPLPFNDLYEDQIFGFRAYLEGKICFSKKELVNYRVNNGMSGGLSPPKVGFTDYRMRRMRALKHRVHTSQARLLDLQKSPHAQHSETISSLEQVIENSRNQYSAVRSPLREIIKGNVILTLIELMKSLRFVAIGYLQRVML